MNQVSAWRDRKPHRVSAKRIVGTGPDDTRELLAIRRVFFAYRLRRVPRRILLLVDDLRYAERRLPVHLADTHRVGDHDTLLPLLHLREVVEPMLRQIDDDPFLRHIRQDAHARNEQIFSGTRHPLIDTRVGASNLVPPQAEAAGNIRKRIFVLGCVVLVGAEHQRLPILDLVGGGPRRKAHECRGQHGQGSDGDVGRRTIGAQDVDSTGNNSPGFWLNAARKSMYRKGEHPAPAVLRAPHTGRRTGPPGDASRPR